MNIEVMCNIGLMYYGIIQSI